ncbi:MAG TPA: ABC transporter ATP-binding protein [Acidimicrobiales bacterium]|nr:ABC transporter ATP-binding protein [Acidimicrobiales bacterium]
MTGPLLAARSVTVRFGGLVANRDVDLEVPEGMISALIGPNGAGKTTLFNTISGTQRPTAGVVEFAGEEITSLPPSRRARLGIGRTFQNLSLVGSLSALDNVTVGLGRFRRTGLPGSILRVGSTRRQDRAILEVAAGALAFVGLADQAERPTEELPYGARRRLELARALALVPRLLLLDEPSAGMGPAESGALADVVRRARDDLGVTTLVVEHDMSFVRSLAERTSVLDFGSVVASGPTGEVLQDERVIAAYLGVAA